ncbi:hypothetical protein LINGRAHAP2_LOCUS30089 [Linum grandiflorum]
MIHQSLVLEPFQGLLGHDKAHCLRKMYPSSSTLHLDSNLELAADGGMQMKSPSSQFQCSHKKVCGIPLEPSDVDICVVTIIPN